MLSTLQLLLLRLLPDGKRTNIRQNAGLPVLLRVVFIFWLGFWCNTRSSVYTVLAGLALLGAIGEVLLVQWQMLVREASLITFLASAANISLLGIGGAFWGLVIGLVASVILNASFRPE